MRNNICTILIDVPSWYFLTLLLTFTLNLGHSLLMLQEKYVLTERRRKKESSPGFRFSESWLLDSKNKGSPRLLHLLTLTPLCHPKHICQKNSMSLGRWGCGISGMRERLVGGYKGDAGRREMWDVSWCSQAERCEGQTILQNLRAEESSFVFLVQGLWY